jgi:hypothetical protein
LLVVEVLHGIRYHQAQVVLVVVFLMLCQDQDQVLLIKDIMEVLEQLEEVLEEVLVVLEVQVLEMLPVELVVLVNFLLFMTDLV